MQFSNKHLGIVYLCLILWLSRCTESLGNDDPTKQESIEFTKALSESKRNSDKDHASDNNGVNDKSNSTKIERKEEDSTKRASRIASSYAAESLSHRISDMFSSKVKTAECRAKVAHNFRRYIDAIANEESFPFVEKQFPYDCPRGHLDYNNLPEGMNTHTLMSTSYQPPRHEAEYIQNPQDLKLLYGVLMHGSSRSTIRLIDALNEDNTMFVIHVDGKENSDDAYNELVEYSNKVENVYVVPDEFRIRVNWGGFTMVNATMQILQYSFGLLPQALTSTTVPNKPFDFHKFINLSSSTYPIKSNTKIRQTLSSYPLDANLMYVAMQPINSAPPLWFHFVECDDALHRIYRLHLVNAHQNGISQYMGSQWMIISHEFAEYLAKAEEGTLVKEYMTYAEHYIISDEGFFNTILLNTRFCAKHTNRNFLHLHFDRWESDIKHEERDERKCPLKDKNHCGRSPTILDKDYMYAFELTDDLFARKFDDDEESLVKDNLDKLRELEEKEFRRKAAGMSEEEHSTVNTSFEGHGVLIVARDTLSDHSPLCLSLGQEGNFAKLSPCFRNEVLGTLANDWTTGAVIEEEVLRNSRWQVGPCSTDGSLNRNPETAEMNMTQGFFSPEGPHCMIKQFGGLRDGRCMDIANERVEPGGVIQVYPCHTKFHQLFSFGDGIVAPKGSIFATVPNHIVRAIEYKGKEQYPYLCFGAMGRSKTEYTPWKEDEDKEQYNTADYIPERAATAHLEKRLPALRLWRDKNLVTIPCNDVDAVIKFLFVPFIVEEDPMLVQPDLDEAQPDLEEAQSDLDEEPKEVADDFFKFHTLDDEL